MLRTLALDAGRHEFKSKHLCSGRILPADKLPVKPVDGRLIADKGGNLYRRFVRSIR